MFLRLATSKISGYTFLNLRNQGLDNYDIFNGNYRKRVNEFLRDNAIKSLQGFNNYQARKMITQRGSIFRAYTLKKPHSSDY